jgi:addiction module RelB/DinJ family antitoxin
MIKTLTKQMTVIQTRVTMDTKQKAEKILNKMGLSLNDYVRVSLNQIINDQQIVLSAKTEPQLPGDVRTRAIESLEEYKRGESVSFTDNETMDTFFDKLYKD